MKNEKLFFLPILASLVLAGCSGGDPEEAPLAPVKPVSEAVKQTRGMVKAVDTGGPGAGVDLKFDLKSRPAANQPLKIDLAFLPKRNSETLKALFPPTPNVTVQPPQTPPEFAKVKAGSVQRYELTVLPHQDGVLSITVIAQVDGPVGPETRTFSIPIVVGPAG